MIISGYNILLTGESFKIDGKEPYEERLNASNGGTATEVVPEKENNTTATTEVPKSDGKDVPAAPIGGTLATTVLMYVLIFGGLYLFWIKPQKKKEQKLREMQLGITTGNDVVTSSGFYGKVVDVTDKAFIVEFGTNKGVRVPVRKDDVFLVKDPTVVEEKTEKTKLLK